jgi:predicted exporter
LIGTLFWASKERLSITGDLTSLLPNSASKELLDIYTRFHPSQEILIGVEGFSKASLERLTTIEKRLCDHPLLQEENPLSPNAKLLAYAKAHAFYLRDLAHETPVEVRPRLQALYDKTVNSSFYTAVDTLDPLGYFKPFAPRQSDLKLRDGRLALGDYGYMLVFSLSQPHPSKEEAQNVYDAVHRATDDLQGVRVFSPLFYFVENAHKIQTDVTVLVLFSTSLLILLYAFMLKNLSLLLNTVLSLLTSTLLALMLTNLIFKELSLIVLAFGNAVGTLAIDYMFHHYFHGHYREKKPFNASVFYGFLTTVVGFGCFAFVDFVLIRQLCVFAMLSLTFSYLQFAFLFPMLGFKAPHFRINLDISFKLPYRLIALGALGAIAVSIPFVRIDTNLRHLDYHNIALEQQEVFFKQAMHKEGYVPFVVKASSLDALIRQSREIQDSFTRPFIMLSYLYDKAFAAQRAHQLEALGLEKQRETLQSEATAVGFRPGLFQNAYNDALLHPPLSPLTLQNVQEMGFDVIFFDRAYYTYGLIKADEKALLEQRGYAFGVDATELFRQMLSNLSRQFLIGGTLALSLMFAVLFWRCRHSFAMSVSYLLLPCALMLLLNFDALNIVHLFMLFIVIAFGVDYGIYMGLHTFPVRESRYAVLFSLASTFAGFGVLIFSRVGALNAMGVTVCVGISAIFILLWGRQE